MGSKLGLPILLLLWQRCTFFSAVICIRFSVNCYCTAVLESPSVEVVSHLGCRRSSETPICTCSAPYILICPPTTPFGCSRSLVHGVQCSGLQDSYTPLFFLTPIPVAPMREHKAVHTNLEPWPWRTQLFTIARVLPRSPKQLVASSTTLL